MEEKEFSVADIGVCAMGWVVRVPQEKNHLLNQIVLREWEDCVIINVKDRTFSYLDPGEWNTTYVQLFEYKGGNDG